MNRSLTAVQGVLAGHWTHESGTTGVTAVLFPEGAVGGVFVPGSASGSRELHALDPSHIAGSVHGFCLAGGSAYGLAAADGVMATLEARGMGFDTGFGRVPIVPAAILFDLHTAVARPDAAAGRQAAEAASASPLGEGRVGAAAGARVAKVSGDGLPGGFGGWAERVGEHTVAVGVAVNALGCIRDPETGAWVAGEPGEGPQLAGDWRGQTTLAVVVTDAPLDRARCQVLARMASAGMARAIWPAFTPFDGDVVLVAATGKGPPPDHTVLAALGDQAARCLGRAIVRAVVAPPGSPR